MDMMTACYDALPYIGTGVLLVSMLLIWLGVPRLYGYRSELKRWDELIASHLKKHVRHEKKLADAFENFEIKRNVAAKAMRERRHDADALDAAMRDAQAAWRHFDALMLAYEKQRREPASALEAITKAPSS